MKNGQVVRVVRGLYKDNTGTIDKPYDQNPSFYWVWLDVWVKRWVGNQYVNVAAEPKRVLLSEGQLEKR
jgi:hypothetical protein